MFPGVQGHHGGTAGVVYYFKLHVLAIGQGQGFNAKLQYPALVYWFCCVRQAFISQLKVMMGKALSAGLKGSEQLAGIGGGIRVVIQTDQRQALGRCQQRAPCQGVKDFSSQQLLRNGQV